MKSASLGITVLALTALLLCGCKTPIPVNVRHGKLPAVTAQGGGTIVLKEFTEGRQAATPDVVGRLGSSPRYFITADGRPLPATLTDHVATLLRQMGYRVIVAKEATVPQNAAEIGGDLDGQVIQFWLRAGTWNNVCEIKVLFQLHEPGSDKVVWEKEIGGKEDDMMDWENAIRAAVDVFLKNAAIEFASSDFTAHVKK
jgi:hypothetical protein